MSLRGRMFAQGPASALPGQIVFAPASQAFALDVTWTVPAGITSFCAVLIGSDGNTVSTIKKNGVTVVQAANGARIGDGGGDGGADGGADGGGGGGGGYAGNGGPGGNYSTTGDIWNGGDGAGGGGGGGGGGHVGIHPLPSYSGGAGGGTGLNGQGANGPGGGGADYTSPPQDGFGGSGAISALYGGGTPQYAGGANAWKNNIPVAQGDLIRIQIPIGASGFNTGGARVLWGPGRSYPTSAGDV